jgi:hypothetical protein
VRAAVWGGADYGRIVELSAGIHAEVVAALEPEPGGESLDVARREGDVVRGRREFFRILAVRR